MVSLCSGGHKDGRAGACEDAVQKDIMRQHFGERPTVGGFGHIPFGHGDVHRATEIRRTCADPAQRAAELEMGKPIMIGRNVWIGAAALILPGVTVGDDAIVGAGAVVTRDVDPGMTVAGNPARPLGLAAERHRP